MGGIRRHGFHASVISTVPNAATTSESRIKKELRLITCHLGNGCSLAIRNDIVLTHGVHAPGWLDDGSRSGSVDPGILIYLMRQQGYTADQLEQVLNRASGLKGIRSIGRCARSWQQRQCSLRAQLAQDIYAHRPVLHRCYASLKGGGLDALVFTAGVGEKFWRSSSHCCL